jgi:hypothetical protein
MIPKVLRRSAASEYLLTTWGVSCKPATLAKLATIGGGPPFAHVGRWPVYLAADLDKWIERRLTHKRASTSEEFDRSSANAEVV